MLDNRFATAGPPRPAPKAQTGQPQPSQRPFADVAEAMLDDRPYRRAWEQAEVLEEIERGRGTLFDDEVMAVVLKLFTTGGFRFA